MSAPHTYNVEAYTLENQTDTTWLGVVTAPSPAAALRKVCGDELAEHDGRYGTLTDGRRVVALIVGQTRRYLGGHDGPGRAR